MKWVNAHLTTDQRKELITSISKKGMTKEGRLAKHGVEEHGARDVKGSSHMIMWRLSTFGYFHTSVEDLRDVEKRAQKEGTLQH